MTAGLRNKFGEIYATYAMTYYMVKLVPYFLLNWFTSFSTMPYTLAFSNTPGLLRPLQFHGKKSIKMQNYIIPAGYTGIGVSCLSYVDTIKIGIVTDESIMKDP